MKQAGRQQNLEGQQQEAQGQINDYVGGIGDRVAGSVGGAVAGLTGNKAAQTEYQKQVSSIPRPSKYIYTRPALEGIIANITYSMTPERPASEAPSTISSSRRRLRRS